MKITTHGDTLIQLTRLTAFNAFLVREDDGFTLVDTGLPGSADGILSAAQNLGGDIKRIVITHAHSDHVASLDALVQALPQVEVIASSRTAQFMQGDMSLTAEESALEATGAKLRGGYTQVETKPTRTVTHGDQIGALQVISAPGHTPDHIALLDTRNNTLIAGDAYVMRGGIAVSGTFKLLFPFPALATWHKPTALKTAIMLKDMNPSRLAVGHGKVLENPVSAMDGAITDAKKSLGQDALSQAL